MNDKVIFCGRKAIISRYFDLSVLLFDISDGELNLEEYGLKESDVSYYTDMPDKYVVGLGSISYNDRMKILKENGEPYFGSCQCSTYGDWEAPKRLAAKNLISFLSDDILEYDAGEFAHSDKYVEVRCNKCKRDYKVNQIVGYRTTRFNWVLSAKEDSLGQKLMNKQKRLLIISIIVFVVIALATLFLFFRVSKVDTSAAELVEADVISVETQEKHLWRYAYTSEDIVKASYNGKTYEIVNVRNPFRYYGDKVEVYYYNDKLYDDLNSIKTDTTLFKVYGLFIGLTTLAFLFMFVEIRNNKEASTKTFNSEIARCDTSVYAEVPRSLKTDSSDPVQENSAKAVQAKRPQPPQMVKIRPESPQTNQTSKMQTEHPQPLHIEEKTKYIDKYYDSESHDYKDAFVIPIMTGSDGADVIISLDFTWTMIYCYHRRSHYAPGFDDSGGCYYDFPEAESLDYLNVSAFIRENTFLGDNGDRRMTRTEYESVLDIIGYTE